jgi:CMP-N-acetylneuraminic acid synthetase
MNSANILGIIPARGGSKEIPKKNLYPLLGKPLISYTIEAAKRANLLTKYIVSTDSEEIAKVARTYGAEVPFIRPKELAEDTALAVDVVKHAIAKMESIDKISYSHIVLLQPTTPLRSASDINAAIDKLIATGCDTVISVIDVGACHPARMYKISNDRLAAIMDEGVKMRPRQELSPVYIRSGDIYACKRDVLFKKNSLIGDDSRPLIIPTERSVNIDSFGDLVLAEHYLKNHRL